MADKPLNIGLVSPGWPLSKYPNGIVTYVKNICQGFDDGVRPTVLTLMDSESTPDIHLVDVSKIQLNESILNKAVDKLLYKTNFQMAEAFRYKRLFTKSASAISHAINQAALPLDLIEIEESFGIPYFLSQRTKVPLISRLHGPWMVIGSIMKMDKQLDYKQRVFFEGEGIKASSGITSPSLDVLEKVRDFYNVELPNAAVIPNPVMAVEVQHRWRLENINRPSILYVGRFDLIKGGDLILQAFRSVALINKEVELVFVGPDRGVDLGGKQYRFGDFLDEFIKENDVKRRIKFLDHCDITTIANLRKNALITVVSSRYENFSLSLLEALAAGCPTVAVRIGGNKEIIVDEFNGLLAEPESSESIAEKVLFLVDNPEKMQLLSQNAIADTLKRFSPETIACQTVDYYRNTLSI